MILESPAYRQLRRPGACNRETPRPENPDGAFRQNARIERAKTLRATSHCERQQTQSEQCCGTRLRHERQVIERR